MPNVSTTHRAVTSLPFVAALLLAWLVPSPAVAQAIDRLPGIDVSRWQEAIDWTQVAASGQRFAIAKATDGRSGVDPQYLVNKAGAETAGLPFTAYHFARPDDTPNDAIAEADHFVDTAQLGPGNLIPALDLERTGGLTQAQVTEWVLAWLGRATERLGVRPMIYTSPNGWKTRTGDTTAVVDAGYTELWVAHWGVESPTLPASGWGGNGWTFWQYGDCGAVPGIEGCVDVDWYQGTSLEPVTIPNPDVTPPTAAISPPGGVVAPVDIAFSEAVRQVTPGNVVVWTPDEGTYVQTQLACLSGKGEVVDCYAGPVRTVTAAPLDPLTPGQSYAAVVNPAGVAPAIVDRAGNPAVPSDLAFVAPTEIEQGSPAVSYAWRPVADPRALGGSYAVEHLRGASASFGFDGGSITWYTVTGRSYGRAAVSVDGRELGRFDQYSSEADFGIARAFRDLGPGPHTLTIRVLGTSSRAAIDTRVAVDAVATGSGVVKEPTLAARWRREASRPASGGSVAVSDTARSSVSFTFRGTSVSWSSVRGPSQGRSAVYLDGLLVRTVDDYEDDVAYGLSRTLSGLPDAIHTLRIVVLGRSRPAADGAFVSIDRFTVD